MCLIHKEQLLNFQIKTKINKCNTNKNIQSIRTSFRKINSLTKYLVLSQEAVKGKKLVLVLSYTDKWWFNNPCETIKGNYGQ